MSSLFSAPRHVGSRLDHRDAILVSGVQRNRMHSKPYLTPMTARSTFSLGTYCLADKNQPAERPCALARIPSTREDVRRSDAWMPGTIGAGCGDGRSSA